MGKLVRDRIPDLIRAGGERATVRVLDEREYAVALRAKLFEEATELVEATESVEATGPAVTEELADVREVLLAVAELHGIAWAEVEAAGERKREDSGGFRARYWLA